MCSKQLPALEWMNNLQAIIYFTQVYIVFDFQNYSLTEVIWLREANTQRMA